MTETPSTRKRWLRLEPRYIIVIACFLATFTAYVERVGFSIAFTGMAKKANLAESLKGTVLSAFYWGYGISQVAHAPMLPCLLLPPLHRYITACSVSPFANNITLSCATCGFKSYRTLADSRWLGRSTLWWQVDAYHLLLLLVPRLSSDADRCQQRGSHHHCPCLCGSGPRIPDPFNPYSLITGTCGAQQFHPALDLE